MKRKFEFISKGKVKVKKIRKKLSDEQCECCEELNPASVYKEPNGTKHVLCDNCLNNFIFSNCPIESLCNESNKCFICIHNNILSLSN